MSLNFVLVSPELVFVVVALGVIDKYRLKKKGNIRCVRYFITYLQLFDYLIYYYRVNVTCLSTYLVLQPHPPASILLVRSVPEFLPRVRFSALTLTIDQPGIWPWQAVARLPSLAYFGKIRHFGVPKLLCLRPLLRVKTCV